MFKILVIFMVIFIGIFIEPLLVSKPGLVLIKLSDYHVKMSITMFLLLITLLILFIFLLFSVVHLMIHFDNRLGRFLNKKLPFYQIQLLLLEGHYKKIEKLLSRDSRGAKYQTTVYLQTAQAAIDNHDFVSAANLLLKAATICRDKEKLALQLVKIRFLVKIKELKQAQTLIKKILVLYPKQPAAVQWAHHIDDISRDQKHGQVVIDI